MLDFLEEVWEVLQLVLMGILTIVLMLSTIFVFFGVGAIIPAMLAIGGNWLGLLLMPVGIVVGAVMFVGVNRLLESGKW